MPVSEHARNKAYARFSARTGSNRLVGSVLFDFLEPGDSAVVGTVPGGASPVPHFAGTVNIRMMVMLVSDVPCPSAYNVTCTHMTGSKKEKPGWDVFTVEI